METLQSENDVNYNVLNALNLVDPTLGELYLENGYNPFDKDFVINFGYIQKMLEKSRDKTPILTEDFLEKPAKEVKVNFENALKNTTSLKQLLENNVKDNIFDKDVEKQVKEVVIFLKNREQMLNKAISNLNLKNPNPLREYQTVTSIDKKLSELLKESYFEEFKLETAHLNFVQLCQTKAKLENLKKQQTNNLEKQQQNVEQQIKQNQQKQIEQQKEVEKNKTQNKEQNNHSISF